MVEKAIVADSIIYSGSAVSSLTREVKEGCHSDVSYAVDKKEQHKVYSSPFKEDVLRDSVFPFALGDSISLTSSPLELDQKDVNWHEGVAPAVKVKVRRRFVLPRVALSICIFTFLVSFGLAVWFGYEGKIWLAFASIGPLFASFVGFLWIGALSK